MLTRIRTIGNECSREIEHLETKINADNVNVKRKHCSEVTIYKKATMMEKTVKISDMIDRYYRIFALQTSASAHARCI